PLTSERDQNFLIEASEGEVPVVLKIANGLEQRRLLEAQQQVLLRLAQHGVAAPRVVCTTQGESLIEIAGPEGSRHFVWAITHVPGVLLADVRHRSPGLLEELGATIGRLTVAFRDVDASAVDREFHWDLSTAAERVAATRLSIADHTLGGAIDATVERVNQH